MAKQFKKQLDHMLKGIAEDVELGERFQQKFDPNYLDYGEGHFDEPTANLFEQSKLDPTQPGHWQFLLSIVAGVIHSERTGRTVFWDSEKDEKLFRAVLKLRKANLKSGASKMSINKICEELKKTPAYKAVSTRDALHARFNIILRRKRSETKSKSAPTALKRDLRYFA